MSKDLALFLEYLQFEKRSSRHTVIAYETDLIQFSDFLITQYQLSALEEANHMMIRSWIVSMMESGMDPRSVNRKITALRTFYRYLIKTGRMERSPMLKVQAPKTKKKLPEYIDEKKMELLFSIEEPEEKDYESFRNFLIVDFFYRTGVRLSELINLKVSDVNLYSLTVTVLGKRNKVRQIPLTMKFKSVLQEYLSVRSDFLTMKGQSCDFFFTDSHGNQITPGIVYKLVKASISRVSTGEKRSPHVLRHSFATAMLNHGADINAIKELLGHSSLAATQVYTHNSIEKLKEIYKQAFPKA